MWDQVVYRFSPSGKAKGAFMTIMKAPFQNEFSMSQNEIVIFRIGIAHAINQLRYF
jgi:hypothetical protein